MLQLRSLRVVTSIGDTRYLVPLLLLHYVMLCTGQQPDGQCRSIPKEDRRDCGRRGITRDECITRSCCFDASVGGSGTPFCYYNPHLQRPSDRECSRVHIGLRVDCGESGITEQECANRGCCYNNDVREEVFCFKPLMLIPAEVDCASVDPGQRVDCGVNGITRGSCEGRGCCFDARIPNVPHCFIRARAVPTPDLLRPPPRTRSTPVIPARQGALTVTLPRPTTRRQSGFTPTILSTRISPLPTLLPATQATRQCESIQPAFRTDCGNGGITTDECIRRSCCFDSSVGASGTPFCYYNTHLQRPPAEVCGRIHVTQRIDCGENGINERACANRGCCFDNNVEGVFCFKPLVFTPTAPPRGTCTDIPVNQRWDCGYSGILPDECLQRRCCFDSSASPFCYFNKFVEIPSAQACQTVDATQRTNCGESRISAVVCQRRGCCFDSTFPDVPHCFVGPGAPSADFRTPNLRTATIRTQTVSRSTPPRGTCTDIPVNQRRDCGYSGILPDECLQRRCCFDSSASPFCYLNKFVEIPSAQACQTVDATQRTNCGEPRISAVVCQSRGCCFDSTFPDVPHCFVGPGAPSADFRTPNLGTATIRTQTVSRSTPPRGTCTDIPVNERRDCGYSGILPDECLQRRCCFDSSASPFCYLNKFVEIPSAQACQTVDATQRTNCGEPRISAVVCQSRGCCFDSTFPDVPHCFVGPVAPSADFRTPNLRTATIRTQTVSRSTPPRGTCTDIPVNERRDCGYSGILPDECLQRRCCFDSSASPFCYLNKFVEIPSAQACQTVDATQRTNCGEPRISAVVCQSRGCCFDSTFPDVPHCFLGPVAPSAVFTRSTAPVNLQVTQTTRLGFQTPTLRTPTVPPRAVSQSTRERVTPFPTLTTRATPGLARDSSDICRQIPPILRKDLDCGHGGIDKRECERRQCCYDDSIPDVPWCYVKQLPSQLECINAAKLASFRRVDCGEPGIKRSECRRRGCCYSEGRADAPFCFIAPPKTTTTASTTAAFTTGTARFTTRRSTATTRRGLDLTPTVQFGGTLSTRPTPPTPLPQQPPATCSYIAVDQRVDCGYPGISEVRCKLADCCYDDKVAGARWCFAKLPPLPSNVVCPSDVAQRMDCGYPTVARQACEDKGCCFDDKIPGVPHCFSKLPPYIPTADQCSANRTRLRRDCGMGGINRDECQRRNCCFDDSAGSGQAQCFFPDAPYTTTTRATTPPPVNETATVTASPLNGTVQSGNSTPTVTPVVGGSSATRSNGTTRRGQTTGTPVSRRFTTPTRQQTPTTGGVTPDPIAGSSTSSSRFTTVTRRPLFRSGTPVLFQTPLFGTATSVVDQGSGGSTDQTIDLPTVTEGTTTITSLTETSEPLTTTTTTTTTPTPTTTTSSSLVELCARKPPRKRIMCDFDDEDECVSNGCCFDDTFEDSDEFPTCYLHDKQRPVNEGPPCEFDVQPKTPCHPSLVFDGLVCRETITVTMSLDFLDDFGRDKEDNKLAIAEALNDTLCLRLRSLQGTVLSDNGDGFTWETDARVLGPADDIEKTIATRIKEDGNWFAGLPVDETTLLVQVRPSNDDNCTIGYRFRGVTDTCEKCPIGSYQIRGTNRFCINCPPQKSTIATGSIGQDTCRVRCMPGWAEKENRCKPCVPGTYKEERGPHGCTRCPTGQTTSSQAATSAAQCGGIETAVTSIIPLFGPKAGGTLIELKGVNLNATDNPTVRLGDTVCQTISKDDRVILCRTQELNDVDTPEHKVPMSIRWTRTGVKLELNKTFTYMEDPEILSFEPKRSIVSGGVNITVTGDNLMSVAKPIMTITTVYEQDDDDTEVHQYRCYAVGASRMLCPAAPVLLRDEIIDALSKDMEEPINDQENIEFFVGFKMDGVTTDEDDMDANEIDVFTDPVFDPNITIPYRPFWPFSETEIVLKGERLLNGANGEEYHVTVGEVDCEAVSVKDTEVVCRLPKAFEPIPRENPDIKVKVGIFRVYEVGTVDYERNLWDHTPAKIGLLCCSIFLVLVIIFVILAIKFRHRAALKKFLTWGRAHRNLLTAIKDEDDEWDDPHPDSIISQSIHGSEISGGHNVEYPYGTIATRMHNEPIGVAGSISGSLGSSSGLSRSGLY